MNTRIMKNLFEKLRKKGKQSYYSSLIVECKNDSKKTWQVMKEITGKKSRPLNNLPKMLKTESGSIYDQEQIANKFNKFFTNVGPELASKIPDVDKSFNFLFFYFFIKYELHTSYNQQLTRT